MSVTSAVRDLLHDRGPLTLDELVALTVEQGTVVGKKSRQTIRTALLYQPIIEPGADTSYVYFSRFIGGPFVRMPMDRARPGDGLLAITPEASALLWPEDAYGARGKSPKLSLQDGPTIQVKSKYRRPDQLQMFARVPQEFWRWWAEQPEVGAHLLCCVDGEAGKFTVRALIEDEAQREEAVARDSEIRKAAAAIMHRTRTIQIVGLAAVCSLGRSTTLARIPAGSSTGTFPPHRPGVYKHVTVMTGSLACCLGETSIDLAAGDSISFPADVARTFHNPGDELAQYFLVIDSSRGASGANRGDRSQ